jgi:exo-beta-1,3-glucanase (GH17 family)
MENDTIQTLEGLGMPYGRAICYSGYRHGQSPDNGNIPTREQVLEDLRILEPNWKYLRLYDCGPHAQTVLDVIREEGLPFKVMLGAYITAELNNFGCPWGKIHTRDDLERNRTHNAKEIERLIEFANRYEDIISSLSAGNEATVDWTDHLVPVEKVIHYVEQIKKGAKQPVTFCENYVPWQKKLVPLGEAVDFISIHTYPVWEYKGIHEGLEFTSENYQSVAEVYPNKPVVITEAGWATNSNGRGIEPENVNEGLQETYFNDLMAWADQNKVMTYWFEAFDEPWKGSPDHMEPEKHWGLYYEDRTPKRVISKQ